MVYVRTTKDITCTIQGDRIIREGDDYIVKKGNEIIGVFDIGTVQFIYLTRSKNNE